MTHRRALQLSRIVFGRPGRAAWIGLIGFVGASVFDPAIAQAGQAGQAGVRISNVAEITATIDGRQRVASSNPVELIVGELLDVTLERRAGGPASIGATGAAIAVTLSNGGNGGEAFDVAASADDASLTVRGIATDDDGDGRFDPSRDRLLAAGRTPLLATGQRLALLVLVDPAAPVTATRVTVTATAATGSGRPGAAFDGKGDGGGDAVVGGTGARARLDVALGGGTQPSLIKTQAVTAPDGSTRPMTGAIVTYSLEARFPVAATDSRIADPVPAGTIYVPGSLRLDDAPLSDAADADPGTVVAGAVAVVLGDIPAAATRTVRFQVRIP